MTANEQVSQMEPRTFSVFTRTNWSEPPRIRHHIIRMLTQHGHKVNFFERPRPFTKGCSHRQEEGMEILSYPELLNHQFHLFRFISALNARFVTGHIKRLHEGLRADYVLNFNYDYDFLRGVFPDTPLITLINDDFAAQAVFRSARSVDRHMAQTCRVSDIAIGTAYVTFDKVKQANPNHHHFYSWAQNPYEAPKSGTQRDVVLFWGYINHRIDWPVMFELAKRGVKLRFVGPVERSARRTVKAMAVYPNVAFLPPTGLDALDHDDLCCMIIPYDLSLGTVRAICVPNKLFNVLSIGLPIVTADIPGLIKGLPKVMARCVTVDEYLQAIESFKREFYALQGEIEASLDGHYTEDRYCQFLEILSTLNS